MAEHENPDQWGAAGYPQEEVLLNDIRCGQSYVCVGEDGHVIGTFCFLIEQNGLPSDRDFTEGSWLDSSPYGIIHRLASDGSRKGTGTFCLEWAQEQCPHMRVYTHTANTPMRSLLIRQGFTQCGILHVQRDPFPRAAYEKFPGPEISKLMNRIYKVHQLFRITSAQAQKKQPVTAAFLLWCG